MDKQRRLALMEVIMREEFKNMKFSHSVGLSTARMYHANSIIDALEHLLNLPSHTQLCVAREFDYIGEYGVILSGDVIAAYDIDCLSKVDENGNRYSRRKECTIEEWENAYCYTEAFLTNWIVECLFYRQQNRKDVVDDKVVRLAEKYGLRILVVPYRIHAEKYYI